MDNTLKILLLGSTGKLGRIVLEKLTESNIYSIGLLLRKSEFPINLLNYSIFFGDILNHDSLDECIAWADVVINCTGKVSYKKKDKKAVYEINFIGTRNILIKCEKYNKPLIHTSSIAVYGCNMFPEPFSECDISNQRISNANSMYYSSKFDSDMLVSGSDISKIIFRPSSFVAKDKSTLKFLSDVINKGILPILKGGASFVLIDDVASEYIKAIEILQTGIHVSYVFNLGGNNKPFNEILQVFKKNQNKRLVKIPYFILLLLGYICDYIIDPYSKGIGISSENVRLTNCYSYVNSDKAIQQLGYKIKSFDNSLTEII